MQPYFEKNEHRRIFFNEQDGDDCNVHYHQNVEIIQMLSGCLDITVRSESKRLMPGEFAIASSYEPHGFRTVEHSRFNVFIFPAYLIADYLSCTESRMLATPFLQKCARTDELNGLLEKLTRYANREITLTAIGIVYTVLGIFIEELGLIKKTKYVQSESVLTQILTYVNEHYLEELTLGDIANRLGYHKSYLSVIFNQGVGYHFNHYINTLRVRYAARLITTTTLSLNEISIQSGFRCTRSFRRAFADHYNQSPQEYKCSHAKAQ